MAGNPVLFPILRESKLMRLRTLSHPLSVFITTAKLVEVCNLRKTVWSYKYTDLNRKLNPFITLCVGPIFR